MQKLAYPRGRGLGGSASINYLAFIRGNRHDYDEWAELGCSGWSYRDVLPYMIKCEDNANAEYASNGKRPSRLTAADLCRPMHLLWQRRCLCVCLSR